MAAADHLNAPQWLNLQTYSYTLSQTENLAHLYFFHDKLNSIIPQGQEVLLCWMLKKLGHTHLTNKAKYIVSYRSTFTPCDTCT